MRHETHPFQVVEKFFVEGVSTQTAQIHEDARLSSGFSKIVYPSFYEVRRKGTLERGKKEKQIGC